MKSRRSRMRALLIALGAIAGMLSLADAASACSTKAGRAPRACCVNRPSSECGCCGEYQTPPASARRSQVLALVSSPARVLSQAPSPSPTCECRADEPVAPSERPAPRTTTDRSDVQVNGTLAGVTPTVRPFPALGHLGLPNESSSRSPLYLRTSRLLI